MKRILLLFCVLGLTTVASAETQWFKTYKFASATIYNGRYIWSDWESSDLNISINLDTDKITVYSPSIQKYQILTAGEWEGDGQGGKQIHYKMVDQDGDRGTLSLRIQANGESQIYIRFNNVAWCYCVYRSR